MITLLDGPMGTELARAGVATPAPGWSAYALASAPEIVRGIHAAYHRAGAEVHRANTFRTQPGIFPDDSATRTALAVRLAREGAPGRTIAGSLAPIADCYRPDLAPPEPEARALHRRMAEDLRSAGVDLIVCETFPNVGEARVAVEEAVRTGLPVWIALTAGPDGTLLGPEAMAVGARDCLSAGATTALVCCTGASRTLPYVERLARLGARTGAYANAGEATEGFGWDADPARAADRYAALAATWLDAGATIVGSCCGTGPAHIAALAALRSRGG